ncbi:MAG: hypothetical protein FJ304_11250 [Planctomycetes bacterium]|nr:hypothetical protein [Planctomycetota bacterium]
MSARAAGERALTPKMMMNCQHCRTLLLDHLYGLLDGAEAAGVDAHLASCPTCAAARAETGRVQGLIARAAKSAFPQTKFEPPAPKPTKAPARAPAKPAVLAFPAPANTPSRTLRRVAAALPWAVAAAVLLAIPGTVVPVLGIFDAAAKANRSAESARAEAATAETVAATLRGRRDSALTDARFKLTTVEQAQASILNQWVEAQKAATLAAANRKLNIDVYKPQTVQPGAPNDFLVVVRDSRENWELDGKRMVAEVHAVDSSDAVIFSQRIDTERKGDAHPLRLPAAAWAKVKPEAELFLVVAQVDEKTGARTELQEKVKLAGPVFATLLVTDKPTYRPGERLFFRSLTLDRITFKPPTRDQILKYELLDASGRPVPGLHTVGTTDLVRVGADGSVQPVRADGKPVRGVGCGEFVLPANLDDGDYKLVLREQQHPGGFPATVPVPVSRAVKVRAGTTDTYRKLIGFSGRAAYAPGDTVDAWAELYFQDKPVAKAAVAAVALEIDGREAVGAEFTKETTADGRAGVRFKLPAEVLDGDVRLKVTFRTPHGEENVAERVPVVGNRLAVEFFPECGDNLVAGVPCKVYVRATTPAGQAVDIRGVVTDGRKVLANVESLRDNGEPGANRGLAAFTYTPELGTRVWLKLDAPATTYAPILPGVPVANAQVALLGGAGATATRTGFFLPTPQAEGVVMSVLDPITAPGEPIRVQLHTVGRPRVLVVGAYTRGKLSDTQKVQIEPDVPQIVKLMAGPDPRGGVVRITCFEEPEERPGAPKGDLKPVAERLVFRKPGEVLNLAITTSSANPANAPAVPVAPGAPPTFTAGSPLNLSILATDEKGGPAAAVLWAAALNTGVAPGPKDRKLPTHFLLAGEVKNPDDLEHADFLLTNHPKAAEALDLVLGTQGWRRFAEQAPPQLPMGGRPAPNVGAADPDLARLMIQNGQYRVHTEPAPVRDQRDIDQKFAPRYESATKAVALARAALDETAAERARDAEIIARAATAATEANRTATKEAEAATAAGEPVRRFRANAWLGVIGLGALALCCGFLAVARPAGRFPLGFSTLGSIGLAGFLVVASGWGDRATASETKADAPQMAGAERATGAQPPAAPLPPGAPARNPEAVFAKGNGKNDGNTTVNQDGAGGGPGKGGFGGPGAGQQVQLKDVRPPVLLQPGKPFDPRINPPKFGPPKFGPPMVGVPYPPQPAPGGGAFPAGPPGGPSPPEVRPSAAPGTGGWEPQRLNGVTQSEIARSRDSFFDFFHGKLRAGRAAEQLDAVKKAAEHANRYAADRANNLANAVEFNLNERKAKTESDNVKDAKKFDKGQLYYENYAAQQVRSSVTVVVAPLVVREYAAPRPAPPALADAPEASDTILWEPVIVLPADGKAQLTFHLGSAPGGYQLVVAGHTADGRLGAVRELIAVAPPKALAPSVPVAPPAP